ncbi:MAG: glycoside hydrolase family 88 protein [Clostridia bacterium]|nr:glycoside hydrolase family 88 protein [Clostridia bacterium]
MDIKVYFKEYLRKYTPYKSYWNYEDGCILKGCIDLYRATGDAELRQFVLDYVSRYVAQDGSIPNYEMRQYNIDSINSGKALYFALEETGEERYRKAIEFHMQRLREHPRCVCGSFWHKQLYPNQIWLDGLYMAQPFYMEYEMKFGGMEKVADIVSQFKNVRRYLWNGEKGLNYHAYDEAREQFWADQATGCSANFWLRSTGWYLMALIDTIGLCTEQLYEHYRALVDIFRESMAGVLRYQAEDGLFYQVIDHGEVQGNYTETSGSAMIAYSLLKAVRLGILDPEKYLPIARRVFEGLVSHKLRAEEDGVVRLTDICWVAGLGPAKNPQRDGSVAYYLSEPRKSDDSKGVGPFIMAYAEYLLQK